MNILGGEKFDGGAVLTAAGPVVPAQLKLHDQYNHAFLIGVRYAFNAAPPPVAPAPPRHRPRRLRRRRAPTWCSSTGTRRR